MAQTDLKKLIAYSSVNHMGYVTLGCAVAAAGSLGMSESSRVLALNGAQMQAFSHGLITGALFFLVGVVYERAHTRNLADFGGLGAKVPVYAGMLAFCSFASLGLPGMTGFIAELSVLTGTYNASPLIAGLALIGIVVTAAYMLWMLQRVLLGPLNPKWEKMPDANGREILSIAPLMALMLFFGVIPGPVLTFFGNASSAILASVPLAKGNIVADVTRRQFLKKMGGMIGPAALAASGVLSVPRVAAALAKGTEAPGRKPNVIFILSDDLGYADLGCYGQKQIETPHIDKLAKEGIRFTDSYAGSSVCAPTRCCLMTGYHTGHARVRGNNLPIPQTPLQPEDVTVAKVLKQAGYSTGIIGKWGLGETENSGAPNRQGFDYFFGYLKHGHAHNYYTDHLWRNEQQVKIPAGTYSHDLFTQEALDFVRREKDKPFFLYLSYTIPHANNEKGDQGMQSPSDYPYSNKPWPPMERNYAAMVTRMDRDIGRLMALLQDLGLDENTVVFFASDNGAHLEGGHKVESFESSGSLRGHKGDPYEGGIRVPMIARWPGKIEGGRQSDYRERILGLSSDGRGDRGGEAAGWH